ncbi:unnamed protein product [Acanthoscelides obtectus]|uniref:ATP-dependent DNA helicase n=1 Tax=Acanthoscelides obtectus TaxID=200917 RepID=A0A9P0LNT4_ACAOB|nr:unnamed protein product [Acanthoscelides obtectus]CAK1627033.1 hypothetical protein AOBTE_LOCUS4241 [Acanthoscelides obtectus]
MFIQLLITFLFLGKSNRDFQLLLPTEPVEHLIEDEYDYDQSEEQEIANRNIPLLNQEQRRRKIREIMNNDIPLGGKIIIILGDFRQCAPIVPLAGKNETISASVKCSQLWQHFVKYDLLTNVRALPQQNEFKDWLMTIGNNSEILRHLENGRDTIVKVPNHIIVENVTESIYDTRYQKPDTRSTYQITDTRYQTPDTRHQTPDIRYQIPDTRHQIPDTRYHTPDTRHQIPDTRYLIPDTRYQTPDTR